MSDTSEKDYLQIAGLIKTLEMDGGSLDFWLTGYMPSRADEFSRDGIP